MNKHNKLTIGLFGFGVVGEGIFKVLNETKSLNAQVKKICIKHPDKKRDADSSLFVTDYNELLDDEDINLIVELIDDADEAYKIVTSAIRKNKAVVSANKKMIAEHLTELVALQRKYDVPLLYEAAVCGSIPVIRNLEEYYDNEMLRCICGIINGSTNYILTKMLAEGRTYEYALSQAQTLGFAESNPELDVSGQDAVNKLVILLLHSYGIKTTTNSILARGITFIHKDDAVFAAEKNYKLKLVAQATKLTKEGVATFVLPQFINDESQLYNVNNEFNGVVIECKFSDKQFLYGKGAGRYPTASAVLSDIAALRYDYRYEYRKLLYNPPFTLSKDFYLRIYLSFNDLNDINKWDFEWIETFYSTQERQYLIGVIHYEKILESSWYDNEKVSLIVMPNGIIEKEQILKRSMKKVSLQLAGL